MIEIILNIMIGAFVLGAVLAVVALFGFRIIYRDVFGGNSKEVAIFLTSLLTFLVVCYLIGRYTYSVIFN